MTERIISDMNRGFDLIFSALEKKPEPEILDLEKRGVANNHDDLWERTPADPEKRRG